MLHGTSVRALVGERKDMQYGISVRNLIEGCFDQVVGERLPHAIRYGVVHIRDLFNPEKLLVLDSSVEWLLIQWQPLYDKLEAALDDLWGLSHDTIPVKLDTALEQYPVLRYLQSPAELEGQGDIIHIPIAGIPQSVQDFCLLLGLMRK